MAIPNNKYAWYVLYTLSNHEFKALEYLQGNGIEAYLPIRKVQRKWSDRKKWINKPLFPNYLFVRVSNREYDRALQHSSIARYVNIRGCPCRVPDYQIHTLRALLERKVPFEILNEQFEPGQIVLIQSGPLQGFQAEVVKRKGKQELVIRVEETNHVLLITLNCKFLMLPGTEN